MLDITLPGGFAYSLRRKLLLGTAAGSGAAAMPGGALGIWYGEDLATTAAGRTYIPNSLGTAPTIPNLLSTSRRLTTGWNKNGATVTDSAVTGVDGKQYASTLTAAADFNIQPLAGGSLPAGTYTIAFDVKRNTGSDQQFKSMMFINSLSSSTFTATSVWQRFVWTVTIASPETICCPLISFDRATGANVQIDNWGIYEGSVDPAGGVAGVSLIDKTMYPGFSFRNNDTVTKTGALSAFTNTNIAQIQFPDPIDWSNATIVAITSLETSLASSGYPTLLSQNGSNWSQLAVGQELVSGHAPSIHVNGVELTQAIGNTVIGNIDRGTAGQNFYAARKTPTQVDVYYDAAGVFRSIGSYANFTFGDILYNAANNSSFSGSTKLFALAYYNRALSDQEILDARSALLVRAAAKSVTINTAIANRIIIVEGDSITYGISANTIPWTKAYIQNASPVPQPLLSYAISGNAITDFTGRRGQLPITKAGRKYIYVMAGGTNNITTTVGSGATAAAAMASHLDAVRSLGYIVVLCTVTPRSNAGYQTEIDSYNTIVSGWSTGLHWDYFIDFRTITTTGWQDPTNTTYWQDGLHPTNAGAAEMEAKARPTLNAI